MRAENMNDDNDDRDPSPEGPDDIKWATESTELAKRRKEERIKHLKDAWKGFPAFREVQTNRWETVGDKTRPKTPWDKAVEVLLRYGAVVVPRSLTPTEQMDCISKAIYGLDTGANEKAIKDVQTSVVGYVCSSCGGSLQTSGESADAEVPKPAPKQVENQGFKGWIESNPQLECNQDDTEDDVVRRMFHRILKNKIADHWRKQLSKKAVSTTSHPADSPVMENLEAAELIDFSPEELQPWLRRICQLAFAMERRGFSPSGRSRVIRRAAMCSLEFVQEMAERLFRIGCLKPGPQAAWVMRIQGYSAYDIAEIWAENSSNSRSGIREKEVERNRSNILSYWSRTKDEVTSRRAVSQEEWAKVPAASKPCDLVFLNNA